MCLNLLSEILMALQPSASCILAFWGPGRCEDLQLGSKNETHQKLEPIQEPDYPDFKLSDLGGILKLYEIVKSEKWFHHANSQTPPCRVPRRIWQHSPLDFEYL